MPGRFARFALVAVVGVSGCSVSGTGVPDGLAPAGQVEVVNARPAREGHLIRVSAGGPPVELPSGFRLTVDGSEDSAADPRDRAILDDAAMLFAAMYQAIGRGETDDPLYRRYAGGAARDELRDVIAVFVANEWTVTGLARAYRRTVELTGDAASPDTAATVSWCADLSAVFPMEITSGHVLESAEGDHSFLRYTGTVERDASGVWVATELESRRAAPECLPMKGPLRR